MVHPDAYTANQWAMIVNEGRLLVDGGWCAEAIRHADTIDEIFGVGRDAPEARHDLKGLVALINGWDVIAIDVGKGTIKNPKTGKTLSIYRWPDAGGRCLLWELTP